MGPRLFFAGRPGRQRAAKAICAACPVRTACLVEALEYGIDDGVWGGLTAAERAALLRTA